MDSPRSREEAAPRCTSVPSEDGRSSFYLELLAGQRLAVRAGRVSLFFTFGEARAVLEAMASLMGKAAQGAVRP